jgi:hypothetical protein
MLERVKQKDDQEKKRTKEKHDRSKQERRARPEQKHAGMATDPQTMKDKEYVKHIEEKTQKH